ncbi:MAG: SctD/MshK family protein [Janthinobacterium lividum]
MTSDHSRPLALRVLNGLHAGAVCTLADGSISIGSAAPSSILLSDDMIAPLHLVAERDGDELRLSTMATGVSVEGHLLSMDETVAVGLPVEVTIGTVSLHWDLVRPDPVHAAGTPRVKPSPLFALRRLLRRPLGGTAALAGLLIACGVLLRSTDTAAIVPGRIPHRIFPTAARGAAAGDVTPTDDQLRKQVRMQLHASGLADVAIRVSAAIVELDGAVDPASAAALHEMELWFDRTYGDRAVLLSHVRMQAVSAPALAVDAVWSGPGANIVMHGVKYLIGAQLPDGSVLNRITDDQILVSRNGARFAIDY